MTTPRTPKSVSYEIPDKAPSGIKAQGNNGLPRLLTIPEVALALRVSKWSVYSLIHSKQLGSVFVRTRHLVPADEVERFVRSQYEPEGGKHGQEKR
ncbi:helix-turn-helix domain-containing protein [Arthrobacter sp. UYCu723]